MMVTPAGTNTQIKSVHSIRDVDPVVWDRLAGPNPLLSHGWLRTMEQEWIEDVERVYFLFESGASLLAAAACYVDESKARAESVDDLLFGRLQSTVLGRVMSLRPALVCGFPWSVASGCISEPGVSETRRSELLGALVEAITREALQRRCSAVFLSVTETETLLMRQLSANGYDRARHEPIYFLDLKWATYKAYRHSLPSKNVRKNIRHEWNRNRKQGVVIRELDNPSGCEGRLHEIVDGHYRRYGWPTFPYAGSWFRSIKANLGSEAVIAVATKEDTVVAVTVSLRKQETCHMILGCVDHDTAGKDLSYFVLSYDWPVVECIRRGDRRYVVGPGQHVLRTRRGYERLNSWIYCRPAGTARQFAMRLWLRVLSAWLRRTAK
jgi:predicted N-acyltransferase